MDIKIDLSNILEVMNPAFHWLLVNKSRFVVLKGGAGSGKSFSVIQALLFKILYPMLIVQSLKESNKQEITTSI